MTAITSNIQSFNSPDVFDSQVKMRNAACECSLGHRVTSAFVSLTLPGVPSRYGLAFSKWTALSTVLIDLQPSRLGRFPTLDLASRHGERPTETCYPGPS
ncbi:hypothetical protein CC2G_011379 [Coprinopsis cinerea AmutBmut pab1-1]|nr:hypothetical protein CC2G_011379 [Coprinopsis cinerea AmutBmut pab1-1]